MDIVESGDLLLAQVNDLLDMARVRAGKLTVAWESVAIAACVRASERVLAPLIAAKGQRLSIALPPDLPPVWVDSARLRQVLINLLTNAHKFTPEGARLRCAPQRLGAVSRS